MSTMWSRSKQSSRRPQFCTKACWCSTRFANLRPISKQQTMDLIQPSDSRYQAKTWWLSIAVRSAAASKSRIFQWCCRHHHCTEVKKMQLFPLQAKRYLIKMGVLSSKTLSRLLFREEEHFEWGRTKAEIFMWWNTVILELQAPGDGNWPTRPRPGIQTCGPLQGSKFSAHVFKQITVAWKPSRMITFGLGMSSSIKPRSNHSERSGSMGRLLTPCLYLSISHSLQYHHRNSWMGAYDGVLLVQRPRAICLTYGSPLLLELNSVKVAFAFIRILIGILADTWQVDTWSWSVHREKVITNKLLRA